MKTIANSTAQEKADLHAAAIAFGVGPQPGVNVGDGPHHSVPEVLDLDSWYGGKSEVCFGWHAPMTHDTTGTAIPDDLVERFDSSELDAKIPDNPGLRGRIRAALARANGQHKTVT